MFSHKIHRIIFLFGSCTLFFGVMLGTVPTSVPQLILLGNWLLEGKFSEKWQRLKSNKLFWVLSALFFIHVIGLVYSTNLSAGWNDVRTKIPLMYLPLIYFSTNPLSKKEIHYLLFSFLIGSFFNIAWCLLYNKVLHHTEEVREVSRFMSHIRLGFLIDMAIIVCVYFMFQFSQLKWRFFLGFLCAYFIIGLYSLGLVTGLANLIIVSVLFLVFILFQYNKFAFFTVTTLFILCSAYLIYKVKKFYSANFEVKEVSINQFQNKTPSGRLYDQAKFTSQVENGFIVATNIQAFELQQEWNKRVPQDSFNLQKRHNIMRFFTLIRFISSKGEFKDSVSISKLSANDIAEISKGTTNVYYPGWSFINKRTYELLYDYFEYKHDGNVNGHSFTMRLFFLKAAFCAIQENWLFGTGTGDVQDKMNECYTHSDSPLEKEWHKRPHNQFVTILVALGAVGLIIFLVSLIYPLILLWKQLPSVYWMFLTSAIVSFIFEDTLETQSGLSFFALFNTLFLSEAYFKKQQTLPD